MLKMSIITQKLLLSSKGIIPQIESRNFSNSFQIEFEKSTCLKSALFNKLLVTAFLTLKNNFLIFLYLIGNQLPFYGLIFYLDCNFISKIIIFELQLCPLMGRVGT